MYSFILNRLNLFILFVKICYVVQMVKEIIELLLFLSNQVYFCFYFIKFVYFINFFLLFCNFGHSKFSLRSILIIFHIFYKYLYFNIVFLFYHESLYFQAIHYCKILQIKTIQLELIQNCDFMGVTDAMEDIIALAWEKDESCEDNTRLVFRFGDTLEKVKDKLYERDLILDFDKEVVYEK